MKQNMIAIFDLGSEENSALAREIRAMGVYSEIYPHDISADTLKTMPNLKGIILNGGPNNVVDGVKIDASDDVYACGLPVAALEHATSKCSKLDKKDLKKFVFDVCKCEANWNMQNFIYD